MRGEHVDALLDELSNLPTPIAAPIQAAWNAKEDLLDLLGLARTNPDREQITRRLHRFYTRWAEAGIPELERLASTVESWWPRILAFLHTGITNAGSEGTNPPTSRGRRVRRSGLADRTSRRHRIVALSPLARPTGLILSS